MRWPLDWPSVNDPRTTINNVMGHLTLVKPLETKYRHVRTNDP